MVFGDGGGVGGGHVQRRQRGQEGALSRVDWSVTLVWKTGIAGRRRRRRRERATLYLHPTYITQHPITPLPPPFPFLPITSSIPLPITSPFSSLPFTYLQYPFTTLPPTFPFLHPSSSHPPFPLPSPIYPIILSINTNIPFLFSSSLPIIVPLNYLFSISYLCFPLSSPHRFYFFPLLLFFSFLSSCSLPISSPFPIFVFPSSLFFILSLIFFLPFLFICPFFTPFFLFLLRSYIFFHLFIDSTLFLFCSVLPLPSILPRFLSSSHRHLHTSTPYLPPSASPLHRLPLPPPPPPPSSILVTFSALLVM